MKHLKKFNKYIQYTQISFDRIGAEGPRKEFFYWSDSGDLMAVRHGPWKLTYNSIKGNLFTGHKATTNVPIVTNLRADPWERYQDESMMYGKWWGEKLWTVLPGGIITAQYLETFKDYPPSQVGGSFGVEQILQKIKASNRSGTR